MKLKNIVITGLLSFFTLVTFAQQDPQFSQNMYNRLYPNPGVAGANNAMCATLLGRQQWVGFEGSPSTFLFSFHGPVSKLHGGLGLAVSQDQIGPLKTMNLKGSYAFRFPVYNGDIGIGVGLGMLNMNINNEWISITDPSDDPTIPKGGISGTGFDLDFGVYYQDDKMYAGVSASHLSQGQFMNDELAQNFNFRVKRHYFIMGGYSFPLNDQFELQPSTFIKTDGFSTQFDLNALAVWNSLFWGGLSYRFQDAVAPILGLDYALGNGVLRVGYSYDITTSKLRTQSSGSHEFMLNYCFTIQKKQKIQRHKTVRFL